MRLDEALKGNRGIGPGFHMLRHVLSYAILALHCWFCVQGKHDPNPHAGTMVLGAYAAGLAPKTLATEIFRPFIYSLVAAFFALSGFLVAGSALRNRNVKVFFANRALRILPALSVEVTLSALILGPIVTTTVLSKYFSDPLFFTYFGNIIGEIHFFLPGVFTSNPWPRTVNASLWTLPAELVCYAIMLVAMISGAFYRRKALAIAVISILGILLILSFYDAERFSIKQGYDHFTNWYIVLMFLIGALFAVESKYIPLNKWVFIACFVGYYLSIATGLFMPVAGFLLAYCTIYVGMKRFPRFDKLVKLDLSYGTYLYSFPITQFVVFLSIPMIARFGNLTSYLIILPVVFVATQIFAAFSWTVVEKPTLKLRKFVLREPPQKAKPESLGIGNTAYADREKA